MLYSVFIFAITLLSLLVGYQLGKKGRILPTREEKKEKKRQEKDKAIVENILNYRGNSENQKVIK